MLIRFYSTCSLVVRYFVKHCNYDLKIIKLCNNLYQAILIVQHLFNPVKKNKRKLQINRIQNLFLQVWVHMGKYIYIVNSELHAWCLLQHIGNINHLQLYKNLFKSNFDSQGNFYWEKLFFDKIQSNIFIKYKLTALKNNFLWVFKIYMHLITVKYIRVVCKLFIISCFQTKVN